MPDPSSESITVVESPGEATLRGADLLMALDGTIAMRKRIQTPLWRVSKEALRVGARITTKSLS